VHSSAATPTAWATRLRAAARAAFPIEVAAPAAADVSLAWIRNFRDSVGHRRPLDLPMLAWLLGVPAGEAPAQPEAAAHAWWALHDSTALATLPIDASADGPLLPALQSRGVEIWTEAELASLHALSWLHRQPGQARYAARVRKAALWLLDNLQPDNATHRPWGVHVFAALTSDTAAPLKQADADLYAQTLLHNALVGGTLDRFSACILWDAANWLESPALQTGIG